MNEFAKKILGIKYFEFNPGISQQLHSFKI